MNQDLGHVEGVPNNPLYYLSDALGSTVAITNMNAGIIDNNRFAPYGEPLSPVAKNSRLTNSPWGYTGESHDIEAGLVYLRARYYEPGTGRFIQQDSYLGDINIPLSRNLYAYAQNNPLEYIDPSGNNVKDIIYGIAEAVDENISGGIVNWFAKKITGNREYHYKSEYDYYLGRVIGDTLSIIQGAFSIISGIKTIISALTGGTALTVGSGGVLSIGGITIVGVGVAAGAVQVKYGNAVLVASTSNFGNDFSRLRELSSNKGSSKTGQSSLDTGKWNKGASNTAEESLRKHYNKHGEEVGATSPEQYLRKAEDFSKNLKGARKAYNIPGYTEGVTRYYKNGKYIDLAPDGTIISFGKQ